MNNQTTTQIRNRLNKAKTEPMTAGLALELMPLLETVLEQLEATELNWSNEVLDLSERPEAAENKLEDFKDKLRSEYHYWRESGCEGSVYAVGAIANIICAVHGFVPSYHEAALKEDSDD